VFPSYGWVTSTSPAYHDRSCSTRFYEFALNRICRTFRTLSDEWCHQRHLALGQAQHGGQTIADHHRCLGGVPYCQPLGLGDAAIGSYLGPSNPRSLGMGTKTHAVATNSLAERRGFELSVSSPERVALTAATPVRIR